jgi:uncharacterized repeat protein (TIGR01451 family)
MRKISGAIALLALGAGLVFRTESAWAQQQDQPQVIVVPASSLPVIANSHPVQPGTMPSGIDKAAAPLPSSGWNSPFARKGPTGRDASGSGLVQVKYTQPPPMPPPELPVTDAAILSIEKTGPSSLYAGQPATYFVTVRNTSNQALLHVRVEDELSTGAKVLKSEPAAEMQQNKLTWNIDRMERGEERRFKVDFLPTGKGDLQARATAYCSCDSAMQAHVFAYEVTLNLKGPQTVQVGETAEFEIQLTNTGDVPATHVVVRDELPEGMVHSNGNSIEAPLGTLAPGEKKILPLRLRVVHKGLQHNRVYVLSEDKVITDRTMEIQAEEPLVTLHALEKQDVLVNHDVELILDVAGTGSTPATATIVDRLPEGLEFISASDGGKYDGGLRTVTWKMDSLTADRTQSLHIRAVARKVGDWKTDITVASDRPGEMRFRQAVHVEAPSGVILDMAEKDEPMETGTEKVYSVHLINQGDNPTCAVQVRAIVPEGMAFVSAESPTRFHEKEQEISFDPITEMQGKSEATFRVRVRALKAGEWRFRVFLSCDRGDKPVCKEESTPVVEGSVKK